MSKPKHFRNPIKGRCYSRGEIAEEMGISRQAVEQIENRALLKLRIGLGLVQVEKIPSRGVKPRLRYHHTPTPEAQELREAFEDLMADREECQPTEYATFDSH